MTSGYFIGLIHKDDASGYGISFPDVPGVIAVADTLDEAVAEGATALGFAFEDWPTELPRPRTLDELRNDADFIASTFDAVIVAVRPNAPVFEAA